MSISAPSPTSSATRRSSGAVTLGDVARAAGVAPMTVSRVLNGRGNVAGETQTVVRRVVEELGYEPNRNAQCLAGGRDHRTIAVLLDRLDFDVTLHKVTDIQHQLSAHGYNVPLHTLDAASFQERGQTVLAREIRRQKPRALICNFGALSADAQQEVRRYHREGGLVVSFNDPADLECDQVLFDRENNTYQAARHLLELGHRDVGLWAAATSGWMLEARLEGFRRALHEWGVAERAQWQFGGGNHLEYERSGAEFAAQLLALPQRPTGLCIVNDTAAVVCVGELMRGGLRVPGDISVVSHDDLPIAHYGALPLTAVSHPIKETACAVVEMLRERIEDGFDGPPRTLTLRGELRVRQSTGPPRMPP